MPSTKYKTYSIIMVNPGLNQVKTLNTQCLLDTRQWSMNTIFFNSIFQINN